MRLFLFLISISLSSYLGYSQEIDSVGLEVPPGELENQIQGTLNSNQPKDPSSLPTTQQYSSENIELRKFDKEKWREIVNSRDYTDARTRRAEQDQQPGQQSGNGNSSGKRLQRSDHDDDGQYDYGDDDQDETTDIDLSWLGPFGKIIFYGAIAVIIIVILSQIIRNTSFKSNPARPIVPAIVTEEINDISELDTEQLILTAHNARDYKLAIRLYFLDLLKKLNERGVIAWTKDKTNRDYLSEIFSHQLYFDDVRKLTLTYERVWYGEHIPTEEGYNEMRSEFELVNQKFKAS